ncbi:Bug family tripartite tricarboxylate transporter substrate binding protein [Granulosicoccus sp. 3-233]|uniref:Bug family tripartite tricarboxylate transporter substrate binding protein n=1 Tax=Granulosicoccus sp. 3-233 TaxID=3417969 RepID=UPI003D34F69E
MRMHSLSLLLVASSILLGQGSALAADYPERSPSLMVSYGAGGATDFQSRIVFMLSANDDYLGQSVNIVNQAGAGGRIGWNWFANEAPADGYSLAAYNIPHFIAQSLEGGVDYDIDSFEPIANWGADPAVVIVSADSEYDTIGQLLDFAQENPARLTLSGAGLFVGHHIAALQIEKAIDSELAYIPTKGGGAAALNAVIVGDVMAGINNLSDAYRARQAGKVKILAVADMMRSSEFLPDVPTLKEAGYDIDNASVNYRGVMVPAGTPDEVIATLADKIPVMFADPLIVSRMASGGAPMKIMRREEVQAMWEKRLDTLKELLVKLK